MNKSHIFLAMAAFVLMSATCKKGSNPGPTPPPAANFYNATTWVTTASKSQLLAKQPARSFTAVTTNSYPTITVDESQKFQTIDGFGYTLTGGSAMLMQRMDAAARSKLIQELFGNGENDIRVNYIRLSIGASDLNETVFTYNDMPEGQTDEALTNFSLGSDLNTVVPVMKEILKLNPGIKIQATPWSAPAWMKDNGKLIGGSLLPKYQQVYANYFVKYIQTMKEHGITIDAVTPQNEPLHPGNNPSLYMTWQQQADFIKNNLGPAFEKAGIKTKIVVYDHNLDHPEYATNILADPQANKYINGSAFHLYAGEIGTMTSVHNAYPDKALYFTEQYTSSTGEFGGDFMWHMKNVTIGAIRNWSRVALQWNLANDPEYKPFTPNGGCSVCRGAITINGNSYTKNSPFYVVGQASKFVPDGSVRITSNETSGLSTAAFLTPENKKVLIVLNEGNNTIQFNIKNNNQMLATSITAQTAATYVW